MASKLLLFGGVALLLCACAGVITHPTYPVAVTPEIQRAYDQADSLFRAKRYDEAESLFKVFIERFGYNAFTDDARFKCGEISFYRGDYQSALNFYRSALSKIYSPVVTPRAQFKAAYSLFKLNRVAEAGDELSKIRRVDASAVLRTRIDSLASLIFASPIQYYLFLLDDYADLGPNREPLQGVSTIVSEEVALASVKKWVEDDNVSSNEVSALPLKEMKGKRSGGYAIFKYAKALYREGEFKKANRELKAYTTAYPRHEYYPAARALLGEALGRSEEAPVKIGLILPLSGKYAIYGESVLHGVECAAGVYDPCEKLGNAALLIRDSGGSPERAAAAVDQLFSADVLAVIGPMLSLTVTAVAERAEQLQIPLITLSQREGVSSIGGYVFRNTVSAESQVATIVDYAVGRRRLKNFLILYPQTEFGREYRDLFTESVKALGGRISASHGYSSNRTEFASDIRKLNLESEAGRNFDAVFIPDSFGPAGYLATTFAMIGVEGVQFLGISRWDDARLISIGGKYVEGAVFPEAFYKKAEDPEIQTFVSRFTQAFGVEPTLLEALGFDSMRMILDAVKNGAAHRVTLRDALARTVGFHGVTGQISFNEERDAVRELPLLTVSDGEIKPLAK